MRIVIDMQGAQTESRFRGIGRYAIGFAKGVINNRGSHEVILVLNGQFANTIEPIRKAFSELLPKNNILVWKGVCPVKAVESGNEARRQLSEYARESFISSLNPDVVHLTSLFEGHLDDATTSVGELPNDAIQSVSIYDLIPLQNREQYLEPNPEYADFYLQKIEYLKRADLFLAISNFTRDEVMSVLSLPSERILNVYTAIDEGFTKVRVTKKQSSDLLGRLGVSKPFVLYTGGSDERKNLARLVKAYAKLSENYPKATQLVFAGKIPEAGVQKLQKIAVESGIPIDHLVFTQYVSDHELILLYNLCEVFVFPSWHEGFGLPAVEAMASGAPVIASNTASLPEVINFNEALFDPFNIDSISQKLYQALEDNEFRKSMRKHGLKQSKKFSWDKTGKLAINRWEQLYAQKLNDTNNFSDWADVNFHLQSEQSKCISEAGRFCRNSNVPEKDVIQFANAIACNDRTLEAFYRYERLPDKLNWRIEGPFDSSYSLALLNREIARGLLGLGHTVTMHSTEGPGDYEPDIEYLDHHKDIKRLYQNSKNVSALSCDVVSRNLYPPRVSDMKAKLNFLHSYAWEESGYPPDWVASFNDYLQGMTLLSNHVHKVMIDAGVTIPMLVSGCGVDHWLRVAASENYNLSAKKFRFLHVSSCFPRKGVDLLLKAYGMAFTSSDDVSLVIKTFSNPHNTINDQLKQLKENNDTYPHVEVIEADLSESDLKALYDQCNILVAPSRAEGFGLPIAEAMLSGLGVITTNWGGQLDFCKSDNSWLLDYQFETADSHFGLFGSVWAEPSLNDLTDKLKDAHKVGVPGIKKKVKSAQQLLLSEFTWSSVCGRLVSAVRAAAENTSPNPSKVGWVTSWGTPCGIATYSEQLISNMPKADITVLAPRVEVKTKNDGSNVIRCWDADEKDDLSNLKVAIVENDIDTIVIQFNYGFFVLEHLNDFILEQIKSGLVVIVMMHSTTDPEHVPHKKLGIIQESLSKCNRVLVHSVNDLNKLKSYQLVNNVTLFPHGILDYTSPPNNNENSGKKYIISSYGFFLPHKGLLELIESVGILLNDGYDVQLNMINAEYPASVSSDLIQTAKTKITENGLTDYIHLNSEFLSDGECLDSLSKADLIVFPYQSTAESSSAAVRYGLAAGKPVAVTPCDIFQDVEPAVHFVPDGTPHGIAVGIKQIIDAQNKGGAEFLSIEDNADRWREEHRYSKVGLRLNNLLKALQNQNIIQDTN